MVGWWGDVHSDCQFRLMLAKSPSALKHRAIFPFLYLQEIKGLLLHN